MRFPRRLEVPVLRFFRKLHLAEQHFLIALAMVVGIGGGFGATFFRWLLEESEHFFGVTLRNALGAHTLLPVIPALGGLLAGILVYCFAREAKGHGVPEVMNAIITRRGIIRARVVVVKAVASALTLGSGGSAGSEGPIIQIGSALGSSIGQVFRMSETNLKTLIACGAAAGISAIFNAPIAGVLFAVEIILGDFTITAFTPVVISSVLSAVVAQSFVGDNPVFRVTDYHFAGASELAWFVLLALIAGAVGVAFIKVLYGAEDFWDLKVAWLPEWVKPAAGGALVGGVGLAYPEVMGVGYRTIEAALHGNVLLPAMLVLLGLKLLTTSLTLGSGGSGGVFAPSLFFGATLGGAFGLFAQAYLPGTVSPPGAFALVGMGAMVSATTHAPLTAMLIIFEMTGSYHIILPLMFTTIIALVVARSLERESIYSLKLARRGIRVFHGRDLSVLERLPVSRIMSKNYDFVLEHTPLGEVVGMIQHGRLHDFPVQAENGRFLGMIWFEDIKEAMMQNEMHALLIAQDVIGDPPPVLQPHHSLADVLLQFSEREADTLPVFDDPRGERVAGVISRADLMRFYERILLLRERADAKTP